MRNSCCRLFTVTWPVRWSSNRTAPPQDALTVDTAMGTMTFTKATWICVCLFQPRILSHEDLLLGSLLCVYGKCREVLQVIIFLDMLAPPSRSLIPIPLNWPHLGLKLTPKVTFALRMPRNQPQMPIMDQLIKDTWRWHKWPPIWIQIIIIVGVAQVKVIDFCMIWCRWIMIDKIWSCRYDASTSICDNHAVHQSLCVILYLWNVYGLKMYWLTREFEWSHLLYFHPFSFACFNYICPAYISSSVLFHF